MNLYPVTVIDDFYDDPDAIRKFALSQHYTYRHEEKDLDYVYPGCRTKDLFELDAELYALVCKKLAAVFHNTEHDVMRWVVSTSFQIVGKDYRHGLIHQDTNTIFAGVLYLSPDAPLEAGTSLFKKNKNYDEAIYKKESKANDERFKNKQPISFEYHNMFDEIVRVNNVYNTLILFEGDIFHCANHFFGSTLEDSRMAQVFFINRIDAQKHSAFPLKRVQAIKV